MSAADFTPRNVGNAAEINRAIASASNAMPGIGTVDDRVGMLVDGELRDARVSIEEIDGEQVIVLAPVPKALTNGEVFEAVGEAMPGTHPDVEIDGVRYSISGVRHDQEDVAGRAGSGRKRVVLEVTR